VGIIETTIRKLLFKTIMHATDIVYYMEEDAMTASRSIIDNVIKMEIEDTYNRQVEK
jgi:hypothetical protein